MVNVDNNAIVVRSLWDSCNVYVWVITLCLLKAEDFEKRAHGMLEWMTSAERHLRYQGTMPDSEEVLEQQLADHQVVSSTVLLLCFFDTYGGSMFY